MPLVRRAATRMFGRFAAHKVHPDEAVAIGAAVQAGLKSRDAALKEVVVTDVCPYSLGTESLKDRSDGVHRDLVFVPIIERNTIIPASRISHFTTASDDQTKVVMRIFQGESLRPADNILLGSLSIPVPPAPARAIGLDVRFTYDINGLLQVEVHVPKTGERRELTIVDDESLTPAQIEQQKGNLAGLKQHPRDNDANRHALARAERCFESMLGDRRDRVGRLISQFEAALDTQDPRATEHARRDLNEQLDTLEGETWL
jgi:molecular chaperone HscC